ncbi:Vacuolar protein sorting-associated protein 53 [Conoideocrella luteorostrata]|uniref:Thioredoxin reductase n=1 Tax=Conoideocrella luteorostrata TaxID=1105319 RepID=A0AAJ0FX56_9HYPO|nr:Vacuolar protein sorting-associated protein 53 [Conoideocrella luteorostrata]
MALMTASQSAPSDVGGTAECRIRADSETGGISTAKKTALTCQANCKAGFMSVKMNGNAVEASALDAVDYDPMEHLNMLFPHPSTVSSISQVSQALQAHQNVLSSEIDSLELEQAYKPDSSLERMQSAQTELAQLFRKIETVRSRAIETEQSITSMTAEIKRLDGTKRNLTLSMTALKRLQMLTTAYEQLRGLAKSRQYRECAGLLQAVIQLMKHFNSYRSIEQIATLSREVSELQRELLEQVCDDFEMAFTKSEVSSKKNLLVESCLVLDALGDSAKSRIITWYVNTELREYRQVFRGNDEAGSLDNIGRRYSWFKRMIKTHEDDHAAIFPSNWHVGELLATAFCDGTREDFKGILERSMRRSDGNNKIDVNLLLSCLQETLDFEQSIEKKFSNESRASIDTLSSAEGQSHNFNGLISVAFEPYLSLWVDSQDKQLASMIPKYRSQPLVPDDEEFSPQAVIPSAIELFHFYKLTLSQCAKLSTSDRLLDLSKVLSKYLDEYAQQVLLHILQAGGSRNPSVQDAVLVLNTTDFWHTNTNQLEENIKKRIDNELVSKVDMSSQSDAFLGVASAAVLALVHIVELDCETTWREMKNTNWSTMDSAGDQSSYVGELIRHVNARTEEILGVVAKQQYAKAFCDKLIEHLATAYINNIVHCRPISEVGAQQMLVDKYALTKSFGNLLSYHNPSSTQQGPPSSFVRRVEQSMSRMDPLLKTLQIRQSPPEGLVQAYLIHIGDRSDTNFKKILELKGIRKQDQSHLLELFGIHRDGSSNDKLVQNSPLLAPLMMTSGMGSTGGIGMNPGAALTAASGSRFDAGFLGEKLLSAARDIGTTTGQSAEKATINENLRNFGKFFRRDIGGLGARFGKGVKHPQLFSASQPSESSHTINNLTSAPGQSPSKTAKLFASSLRRTLRSSAGLSIAAAAAFQKTTSTPGATAAERARKMHSKVVIIGSGPAAHTAAVYLARAELKPVLYEGFMANGIAAGGQLTTTTEVENFPGFPDGIMGQALMDNMKQQSERFGTEVVTDTVSTLDLSARPFKYTTEFNPDETHTADAVIIATGASARRMNLPGEDKYWQNGISACAVCDGALPIFRNKPLYVIGGGDSAAEEATFLTKYGSHVTVLVRRDVLRASKAMATRLLKNEKVTVRFNSVATEVRGGADGLMTHIVVKDTKTGKEDVADANGLFYAIGHDPATNLVKGQVDMDSDGYILTKPGTTLTSIEGVFAAGDVQDKKYRQAITSAGTGCMAALEAEKFISEQE